MLRKNTAFRFGIRKIKKSQKIPTSLLFKYFYLLFLIEFIGLTLVHKTIQVSSLKFNKTASAHCIVCPLPKAKSLCNIPSLNLPQVLEESPFSGPSGPFLPWQTWTRRFCLHKQDATPGRHPHTVGSEGRFVWPEIIVELGVLWAQI